METSVLYQWGISIHTPHAGSDCAGGKADRVVDISIHTPHAGSDSFAVIGKKARNISIHTPHAGSDSSGCGSY